MQKHPVAPVISLLRQEGESDDYIADVLSDITTAVTIMLYTKAMEIFSEEDTQAIDACNTDEQANELIVQLYATKVGSSPQELMNTFLRKYTEKFLQEYDSE